MNPTAMYEPIGNGWCRCSLTYLGLSRPAWWIKWDRRAAACQRWRLLFWPTRAFRKMLHSGALDVWCQQFKTISSHIKEDGVRYPRLVTGEYVLTRGAAATFDLRRRAVYAPKVHNRPHCTPGAFTVDLNDQAGSVLVQSPQVEVARHEKGNNENG